MKSRLIILCLAFALGARAGEIGNEYLKVTFGSGQFSIVDQATGRAVVTQGKLDGVDATSAAVEGAAADEVFGKGQYLAAGGTRLEVYPGLPFVLVRETVANRGTEKADFQKVIPASFTINLSSTELTTMGTGGLLPPDKNPGSYLFLAAANPDTREGIVAGWITQKRGSGTVFSSVNAGQVEIKAQIEHGHLILAPGQSAALDTFAIGWFGDARLGLEDLAGAVAKEHNIKLHPKSAVYCSWYTEGAGHGRAGSENSTAGLAGFCAKARLNDYGLGVIQIDDGWQPGPQWGGPAKNFENVNPNGPYKNGITPVAQAVRAQGLSFGLWWLPFGRNWNEGGYKDRQDWFWKWADGRPLVQKSFGGTCLDSSVPAVQEQLTSIARTMRSWGVTYFKMDGLSDGCGVDHCYINDGYKSDTLGQSMPAHDPAKTNIEVMREGLQAIRKGAGDDVFFSGCCASQNMRIFAGAIGLVDSMRIGPDFNHDGRGILSGPLRGSRLYFLNGRVWWNDPDPCKVRASDEPTEGDPAARGAVSLDQARLTTSWVSLTNQFFLVSDWLPNLPPERLEILKRTMLPHSASTRPVDYFDHEMANTWLVSDQKSGVRRDVVGMFNFEGKPLHIDYSLAKVGLAPKGSYYAFDFWKNALLPDITGGLVFDLPPASCKVIALRAAEGHPVLLSTSRHITQGIVDVASESWSGDALSGISDLIANDPCELRIRVPAGWKLKSASAPVTETPGLVRMTLRSAAGGQTAWRADFTEVPKTAESECRDLRITQSAPLLPVHLIWQGDAPFYEIRRDGAVIEPAFNGLSYDDTGASAGKSHSYSVKTLGGSNPVTATIKTKAPVLPPLPPKPAISLMNLKPLEISTGWGSPQIGKEAAGGPLRIGEETFTDGIGLHANARAVYEARPEYRRFVAIVGIDESRRSENQSSLSFSVLADDKTLAQSPVMRFGGVERWHFDVNIPAGTKRIVLIVDDAGDGNKSDHGDWVNAGFLTD